MRSGAAPTWVTEWYSTGKACASTSATASAAGPAPRGARGDAGPGRLASALQHELALALRPQVARAHEHARAAVELLNVGEAQPRPDDGVPPVWLVGVDRAQPREQRARSVAPGAARGVGAQIANARVWSVARTAAQLETYSKGTEEDDIDTTVGLVAWWPLVDSLDGLAAGESRALRG